MSVTLSREQQIVTRSGRGPASRSAGLAPPIRAYERPPRPPTLGMQQNGARSAIPSSWEVSRMAETGTTLTAFSDALASAVERAATSIVSVYARRRQPASGVAFAGGVVVTADHVIEQDEEIAIGLPDGKRVG